MDSRLGAAAVLVLLAVAGPVAALPQPSLYFLKDGALGPAGDGLLNATLPNGTEPAARPILVGQENLLPVRFATPAGEAHPDRLYGPLFIGLWTGESAVLNGNLTATLYELTAAGAVPLANASVALDLNASEAPDPTSLVPPDPTDPQAAVLYVVAQALPLVLNPPQLLYLGVVDIPFSEDAQFAIGFRLDAGSSPLPVPVGAFAQVQYDSILTPSFVYAPWYAPDPPRPTPTPRPTTTGPGGTGASSPAPTTDGGGGGDDGGNGAPGFGPLLALAALGTAFALWRRRVR